jgi:hypothetical protein
MTVRELNHDGTMGMKKCKKEEEPPINADERR